MMTSEYALIFVAGCAAMAPRERGGADKVCSFVPDFAS